jgi:hypothetical protein
MNPPIRVRLFAVIGSLPLFAGCGGGGADESPAAQTERPDPPPRPSRVVTIFSDPTSDLYASLGSSTTDAGNGYDSIEPDARLTDVSLESMYQPLLRYTASGNYEIQMPGAGFDRLAHYAGLVNPTSENNFFQPASARQNYATFIIFRSRLDGYRHSELASWTDATALDRAGWLAFGTPTPSAAIAASGSATYHGRLAGMVDVTFVDYLYGGSFFSGADGTVTLTVDFATRTITGSIEVNVDGQTVATTVPLLAQTFLRSSDTWSGAFETSQSGFNEFKVRLTGPDASELIGSWAVPIMIDGEPHQMMGAWIAARD